MAGIKIKRAYDKPSNSDGLRILVDRLWPRGLAKDVARIDHWLKDVAPSAALRRWFGHDPARWAEFRRRYRAELAEHPEALATLKRLVRGRAATLVFAARDAEHCNAAVLRGMLAKKARPRRRVAAKR